MRQWHDHLSSAKEHSAKRCLAEDPFDQMAFVQTAFGQMTQNQLSKISLKYREKPLNLFVKDPETSFPNRPEFLETSLKPQ